VSVALSVAIGCVGLIVIGAVVGLNHQQFLPFSESTSESTDSARGITVDVDSTDLGGSIRSNSPHGPQRTEGSVSARDTGGFVVGRSSRRSSRTPSADANASTASTTPAPPLAQSEFRRGRELFDAKKYAAAADAFERVLTILGNSDLNPASAQLKATATEFANLSIALSKADPHIYTSGDPGVTEPVALREYLPDTPAPGTPVSQLGVLEVVVSEEGSVESVHLRSPGNRYRDKWWVSIAKTWQFRPAMRNGVPVRFLKRILITQPGLSDPQ
jgi:hypothetical protein